MQVGVVYNTPSSGREHYIRPFPIRWLERIALNQSFYSTTEAWASRNPAEVVVQTILIGINPPLAQWQSGRLIFA